MIAMHLVSSRRVAPALLAILLTAPALAQDPAPESQAPEAIEPTSASAHVTPQRVTLGEPFELVITLTHPGDQRWDLATPEELGAFSLLDSKRQRTDAGGVGTTVFTLQMSLFELGPNEVPPLTFDVMTPEGHRQWASPPVVVEGAATLPDDVIEKGEELRGDKRAEDVPVLTLKLLWYALLAIAAMYLLWRLVRWWRSRPAREGPRAPPLPLDVRTRSALEALRAERLPEAGRQKEFYSRLADILRGFVGELFRVEALESTTAELSLNLRRAGAPAKVIAGLRELLEEADLVKFAKLQVDPAACHSALDTGHRLIDLSVAPPAIPTPPSPPTNPSSDAASGPQLS